MMDYKEAIELLHPETSRNAIWKIADEENAIKKIEEALVMACEAMQELQEYHKTGLSHKQVADTICELSATKRMLGHYKQLGTLEEVRKAVEKQNAEKPKAYRLESHGVYDVHLYCCPSCECSIIKQDNRGFFSGPMAKHCLNCGQKLDWTEVEE